MKPAFLIAALLLGSLSIGWAAKKPKKSNAAPATEEKVPSAAPTVSGEKEISSSTPSASSPAPVTEKKAAAPKTQITGKRMNLLRKGEAVEFVGAVKMVRGNDFLSADRMVSEEKRGFVQAWGDVYMRRDVPEEGFRWEAWGDEGVYDSPSSSGTLRGKKKPARVRRGLLKERGSEEKFEMEADKVTFFRSTAPVSAPVYIQRSTAVLSAAETVAPSTVPAVNRSESSGHAEGHGRVYLKFEDPGPPARETEVWARDAFYDGLAGNLVFWGGYDGKIVQQKDQRWSPEEEEFFSATSDMPRARQVEESEIRDLSGEIIAYFVNEKRLAVENNVKALLLTTESPKK